MSPPGMAPPEPPRRSSGVLLHLTSLPGEGGIGDLGDASRSFLDWLAAAGQSVWQVLPFHETGFGSSPYGTASSFAGNRLLISLAAAAGDDELGLAGELPAPPRTTPHRVDYGPARRWKEEALRGLWTATRTRHDETLRRRLDEFSAEQSDWLADWALYAAIKDEFGGASWLAWSEDLRRRRPRALADARSRLADEIDFQVFVQYLFARQWRRLRQAAGRRGVRLLGDLPIYPALDSADVWSHQHVFDLDDDGRPRHVAGVPPDYFSPTGQLWGNPVYHWDRLAGDGFGWWIGRLRRLLEQVDLVRLDHFRGFAGYWRVPAAAPDASGGEWVDGPGEAFFDAVRQALGDLPLVAEDLGVITPDVEALRRRYGLPGMKVLQFGFDEVDNEHLPHHHTPDSIAYTATHDNDTTRGWFDRLPDESRQRVLAYLGATPETVPRALLRTALASVAHLAITPAQDLLGLGSDARMNTPGEAGGNWAWRLEPDDLDADLAAELRRLTELTGRLPAAGAGDDETATAEPAPETDGDEDP